MSDKGKKRGEVTLDEFALESILAEYKGSAFINGDKKTPPELLNEQAERILREAAGDIATESLFLKVAAGKSKAAAAASGAAQPSATPSSAAPLSAGQPSAAQPSAGQPYAQQPVAAQPSAGQPYAVQPGSGQPYAAQPSAGQPYAQQPVAAPPSAAPPSAAHLNSPDDEPDNVILFFDNYRSPDDDTQDTIVRDVEKAIEKELGSVQESKAPERRAPRAPLRTKSIEERPPASPAGEFGEPELREAANRFALACNSISLRCIPAAIISLAMVMLTFAFEADLAIPFGIGHNQIMAGGALMLCLLVVMALCVDIIVRGAGYLIRGVPNAETLILFSCAFSLISAMFSMLGGSSVVLPYCAVSALTLTFAAFGEKFNLRAITETLKTAAASAEPYGLQAEYNGDINKSVLKKAYNRVDGFYDNLMHPDVSETAFRYAAPILLAAALLLSLLTVLIKGGGELFLHILSALLAAAAPFSLLMTFSVPFSTVAKSIRKSGTALAGWGGADDVCFTDGACVTDEDLFPPGTVKLTGVKLFDDASPEKAIRYTASLIMASGSGLSSLFSEVLKTQGMNKIKVEDFACYEGGIGALVRGERVATGSAAFMNLLGIRVPDDTNMKNAVYTAVENRLIAMFTVDYTPINSVQSALISILKWRIKLFFAVRDFNVTPLMLEQKFRVSLEGIEYIQTRDSYSISDVNSGKQGRMAAVLTREGLGPFAEAVTGGRLLKSAALVATAVSVISAAFGVLLMFYMCWSGAFLAARPGNLVLFMLSMLAAVLIVCFYVKCRR